MPKLELPPFVVIDGATITRNQFIGAMLQYGDDEGYSYDPFDTGMTWLRFVEDQKRSDGRTEREVWLETLEHYL